MTDKEAIQDVISRYVDEGFIKIRIEKVSLSILVGALYVCDITKHMEYRTKYYDDEEESDYCSWEDVEGEGYGWMWLNHPEEKWHELLKAYMLEYTKSRNSYQEYDEYVVIVQTATKIIYHFIERKSHKCDTIFTFSDIELTY